jgi:alpha-L-fucosidase
VGTQWAYKPEDQLRSLEECLCGLICCAIADGNFLFNVGPRPDGLIEESHAARLREMGQFLKKYGESIYGTRGGRSSLPTKRSGPRMPAALSWLRVDGGAVARTGRTPCTYTSFAGRRTRSPCLRFPAAFSGIPF